MSFEEWSQDAWNTKICNSKSFRGILSKKYNLKNINFSKGGSSNQEQFYRAELYFGSNIFESQLQQYDKIIVLWGLTSIFRNMKGPASNPGSYFLTDKNYKESLIHFDEDLELHLLKTKIHFWNRFFKTNGITNFWYDSFNTHNYDDCTRAISKTNYDKMSTANWPSIENLVKKKADHKKDLVQNDIWNYYDPALALPIDLYLSADSINILNFNTKYPRDLLSQICKTKLTEYHLSNWHLDWDIDARIQSALDKNLVNPFSKHPTELGHKKIATLFEPTIESVLE